MEKLIAKREKEVAKKATEKAKRIAQAERIEFAQGLLADNMSLEKVAKHTKLSLKEVRKIAEKMSA